MITDIANFLWNGSGLARQRKINVNCTLLDDIYYHYYYLDHPGSDNMFFTWFQESFGTDYEAHLWDFWLQGHRVPGEYHSNVCYDFLEIGNYT